ncbi:hypothetical protein M0811_08562 [Anaeramoeba ignava]|uniref:Uncharacterized protein n=1 Tax=Anaeramoeba ignava TaxID=1746090 RepID=A0A9Q0LLQ2_ANAIG|nr:hypothetical protein M0811_08562 [Anaeramoeba ignava]
MKTIQKSTFFIQFLLILLLIFLFSIQKNENENENKWNQIQILTSNYGEEDDFFGVSISISKDENILLIGAPYAKVGDNEEQGKVYIFQKNQNENKWNQIQILTANDGKQNDFLD